MYDDMLWPRAPGTRGWGDIGLKVTTVDGFIEALKSLEKISGKIDGLPCYKIRFHRNDKDRFASLRGINGDCDIVYQIAHGLEDPNDPSERRLYPRGFLDPRKRTQGGLIVGAYADLANQSGKEYCPYGCWVAPNRNNTTTPEAMYEAITESINGRIKNAPDCCPKPKKVCFYFGEDLGAFDPKAKDPTYPVGWNTD